MRTAVDAAFGKQRFWGVMAWAAFAFIAVATLSPIGLRPHVASAHGEHFAAFAAAGLLFGLGYRRPLLTFMFVGGAAISLELLQLLTPDRHARAVDVAFKLAGGAIGTCLAWLLTRSRDAAAIERVKRDEAVNGP